MRRYKTLLLSFTFAASMYTCWPIALNFSLMAAIPNFGLILRDASLLRMRIDECIGMCPAVVRDRRRAKSIREVRVPAMQINLQRSCKNEVYASWAEDGDALNQAQTWEKNSKIQGVCSYSCRRGDRRIHDFVQRHTERRQGGKNPVPLQGGDGNAAGGWRYQEITTKKNTREQFRAHLKGSGTGLVAGAVVSVLVDTVLVGTITLVEDVPGEVEGQLRLDGKGKGKLGEKSLPFPPTFPVLAEGSLVDFQLGGVSVLACELL